MVLGINRRNAVIARENPAWAIRLVRDKVATKDRLVAAGVPTPPTLAVLSASADVQALHWPDLGERWVMKPRRGSRGRGVLVVVGRGPNGEWLTPGGPMSARELVLHAAAIIDGEHSAGGGDAAMIEPLLTAHPTMAAWAPFGLPDVRVICHRGEPLMAMLRLPTVASGGRGNLHQGGVGAAVDLTTGVITRAVHAGREISEHPDTRAVLVGAVVHEWPAVIRAAAASGPACGLGYAGIDLVIDDALGVLVLEVNGHPGLEIQNVNGRPIRLATRG